jgi:hypothetical protein
VFAEQQISLQVLEGGEEEEGVGSDFLGVVVIS